MARSKESEATHPAKRRYRGSAQAEIAALTRKRILNAVIELYEEQWLDQLTLEQVASRAGVTVQTVIRHFGNKEQLFNAAGEEVYTRVLQQRDETPVGDAPFAIRTLMDHYEEMGHRVLRSLAEEARYPIVHKIVEQGRIAHRAWVERVFAPDLESHQNQAYRTLLTQLVVLTDVYTWKLMRLDGGLSRPETESAILNMIDSLLASKSEQ